MDNVLGFMIRLNLSGKFSAAPWMARRVLGSEQTLAEAGTTLPGRSRGLKPKLIAKRTDCAFVLPKQRPTAAVHGDATTTETSFGQASHA